MRSFVALGIIDWDVRAYLGLCVSRSRMACLLGAGWWLISLYFGWAGYTFASGGLDNDVDNFCGTSVLWQAAKISTYISKVYQPERVIRSTQKTIT